jgi:hypothetical protein
MTRSSKETHMKMTKTLMVAVLAAAGLAAAAAEAQNQLSRGSGGTVRSGSAGANFGDRGGRGNWSGHHNGGNHWSGHHGHHWHGGYPYWGGRYWGPRFGVYIGAPVLFGSYYWGSPWWDDYYYPRSTVVYRERIVEPYPASYPEYEVSSTEIAPRAEGAPTQAPSYRNYCESAKAYYPKVTKCPEGWRFEPSR